MAQVSARTGFLISAEDKALEQVNTGPQWQTRVNRGRLIAAGPDQLNGEVGPTYYVAGAPETHNGAVRATDWMSAGRTSGDCSAAVDAVEGWEPAPWRLDADPLPQMEFRRETGGRLVRAQGVASSRQFPEAPASGRAIRSDPRGDANEVPLWTPARQSGSDGAGKFLFREPLQVRLLALELGRHAWLPSLQFGRSALAARARRPRVATLRRAPSLRLFDLDGSFAARSARPQRRVGGILQACS